MGGEATFIRVDARDGDFTWTPIPIPTDHLQTFLTLPADALLKGDSEFNA
jgi:hypothetical protein